MLINPKQEEGEKRKEEVCRTPALVILVACVCNFLLPKEHKTNKEINQGDEAGCIPFRISSNKAFFLNAE
jgi:hypothetical protein